MEFWFLGTLDKYDIYIFCILTSSIIFVMLVPFHTGSLFMIHNPKSVSSASFKVIFKFNLVTKKEGQPTLMI